MNKFNDIIKERDMLFDRSTGEALQQINTFLESTEEHLIHEGAFPEIYGIVWMACDIRQKENDLFVHVAGVLFRKNTVDKTIDLKDDNFINQVIRISVPIDVALQQNKEEVKTYLALVSTSGKFEKQESNLERESPDFNYSILTEEQRITATLFKKISESVH